ncbi:glucose 1-dehydrogenase [Falsibacillus albus]|uniref:SDR family oxidoreductase n=1 Tax=Falsibacillus albus TaxID=2478915 RepID=A0A3L7K4U5_9BACI|nr:glucose 1-dehydrogenase [Falsibacillus albus]RLQ97091.1 SDR family oxidoreductase [Falsibacillus albus]
MFNQKIVVVTGGAQGIGKGIAKAFAQADGTVIFIDRNLDEGNKTLDELKQQKLNVQFVQADLSRLDEASKVMKSIADEYGKIDILINNAGASKFQSIWEVTEVDWNEIINNNLSSVFYCSREAAKYMKETGGTIVNVASTRAFQSEANTEAYSASKGGISSLTHALAITLGNYGIRVNAISPGWIETSSYEELREVDHGQHPANRVGKPEDVAKACLYLADPANDFVTGINLVVDGGMTRKMIYEH